MRNSRRLDLILPHLAQDKIQPLYDPVLFLQEDVWNIFVFDPVFLDLRNLRCLQKKSRNVFLDAVELHRFSFSSKHTVAGAVSFMGAYDGSHGGKRIVQKEQFSSLSDLSVQKQLHDFRHVRRYGTMRGTLGFFAFQTL